MTVFLTSDIIDSDGIAHGFFTRQGGVSQGLYASLNCSAFSADIPEAVGQNRSRVAAALGGRYLVTNKQIHGNRVREVKATDDIGTVVEADGLVTAEKGICLGALGADCAPVVFADAEARLVGVAHAGWQGALAGVTDSVVEAMISLGSRADSIRCAIGPAIQWRSYEVGDGFRKNFLAQSSPDAVQFFGDHPESGKVHFDLPGYIGFRLKARGVGAVDCLALDTYADADRFFSYRRSCHRGESDYGRQVGAVCLL